MDQAEVEVRIESEPGATAFVWASWALLTAGVIALVVLYGHNVPVWDDYDVVDVVVGAKPFSWEWVWSQHNEHRVALPRLLLLGLDRLTGHDVRAGMFASAGVLSAVAAVLILAVRRMRGGLMATDAFLPIVCLSVGQYTNLLWGWQLQFTLATGLTLALLAMVAMQRGGRLSRGGALAAGVILAALPVCGASGLAIVPFGAAWLLLAAFGPGGRESGRSRADQGVILACALPGMVLAGLTLAGLEPVPGHPAAADMGQVGRTFLQFISLGLGPSSGWFWRLTGPGLLAVGGLVVAILLHAVLMRPGERLRDCGLLLFLGATTALAVALAYGRAGSGAEAGLEARYVTLAVPPLCSIYLASVAAVRRVVGRLVQMTLFLVACVFFWPNTEEGIKQAKEKSQVLTSLEGDIAMGAFPSLVIRGYGWAMHPSQDYLADVLPKLRERGFAKFEKLQDDPPTEVVELPIEPSELKLAKRLEDGSFELTGVDPEISFRLQRPTTVLAVRIGYDYENAAGDEIPARFVMTWQGPEEMMRGHSNRFSNWNMPIGEGLTTTVNLVQSLQQFRIQPDNRPGRYRIRSLELIVPKPQSAGERQGGGNPRPRAEAPAGELKTPGG